MRRVELRTPTSEWNCPAKRGLVAVGCGSRPAERRRTSAGTGARFGAHEALTRPSGNAHEFTATTRHQVHEIRVRDNGIGIPSDAIGKSLTGSKSLGADIRVESEEGVGTEFVLTVPAADSVQSARGTDTRDS
jgi:hypothetical protein